MDPMIPMIQEQQQPPRISREMFESVIDNPVLLPHEKAYVLNRAIGEYSAFSVIDHLRAVETSQRHLAREELGESWSEIDGRTRGRYQELMGVLDAITKGEESFRSFMTWNWITLRAMDSFREAARESDDVLERVTGGVRGRDASNEAAWDLYRDRFSSASQDGRGRTRVVAADVDRYTLSLGDSIRDRYGRELSLSTPFMNQYIDAACLMELSQMHTMMNNFGRSIDEDYLPSEEVELKAQQSVLSFGGLDLLPQDVWRPSRDDIIVALQDGTFDELLDRTVMPDDEFDELMSETMDQFVTEHSMDPNVSVEIIDFMDRAEQSTGRAIYWHDGAAQTELRRMQELRNQQVVSVESTPDHIVAVDLDANGMPDMSQVASPDAPVLVEDAVDEPELVFTAGQGRSQEDEDLIASLEHSHHLDEDEVEEIDDLFESGDARRAREILEERAEEAEADAEAEAKREVEAARNERLMIEAMVRDDSFDFLKVEQTREEPDFA